MAKTGTGSSGSARLGASVLRLLEHEKVELRSAAATVLAAVGKGDDAVVEGLAGRLSDADASVRRIALEGLAAMGATGIAPRLVPLLRGDDEGLAERAAQVLATQGAAAESALKKEVAAGAVHVRRAMAQILIARGSASAVEAVLDQLADSEVGEQMLQLLRAEIDHGNEKTIALIEKSALGRTTALGKKLKSEWNRVMSQASRSGKAKGGPKKKNGKSAPPPAEPAAPPAMDPAIAAIAFELGLLLRVIGYRAQPACLPLLIAHVSEDLPRSIRLAAIAVMRRVVAASEAKGTDKAIEMLIALAGASDLVVAQAAIDTLAGARVPERLARQFAALVKSKNPAAQKLAMSRLPAGGGAAALKALIDALAGADLAARDAAARGLAKAPEAVLPLARALCAASDVEAAKRYAALIRQHRAHVSTAAGEEMAEAAASQLDARGKHADQAHLLARVLLETLAQVAPHQHVAVLFNHARKLRRAGKPVEAFGALRPLLHSPTDLDAAIDDDQRFILAVLGLEAIGQGILRATGADGPVLEQFARLYQRGYPVAKKLAREKDVGDDTVYALGFRLLESQAGIDQEFGAELMQGIIDERPRSKLAKNARNKLKLAGYLDA